MIPPLPLTAGFRLMAPLFALLGQGIALAQDAAPALPTATPARAEVSIGQVRDRLEQSAVRYLAKYGDTLRISDKLVPIEHEGERASFYTLTQEALIDKTDRGQFGGVALRAGVHLYSIGMKTVTDAPPREDGQPVRKSDLSQWMHVFPIQLGFESGRDLKQRDLLLEAGYMPVHAAPSNACLKLGLNPMLGVFLQWGRQIREPQADAAAPDGQTGVLRRIKAEAKLTLPLSCLMSLAGEPSEGRPFMLDLSRWVLSVQSRFWRDDVDHKGYRQHQINLRIPSGNQTFIDLKRDIGTTPTQFDTGAQFSANLTVQF